MKHNKYGITLIEILVVLCLVMLLASLVVTNVSFLDHTITHTQVDKLYNICYYLRQQAMATNREMVLSFDVRNNSYSFDGHKEQLPSQVMFGFFSEAKGPPGNPESSIASAITFPATRIHFYPTGIVSSGTLYIIDKGKKHMYALS